MQHHEGDSHVLELHLATSTGTKMPLEPGELLDQNAAILVSDLSGFTRLTRKHGIVHFASIIMRMRQLVLPILNRFQAESISTEGDNFIVVFTKPLQATLAAIEFSAVIKKFNDTLDDERAHFRIALNGIGLACGPHVMLDTEGMPHGEVAQTAYNIGEDICEGGRVLMTKHMHEVVKGLPELAGAEFKLYSSSNKADPALYEVLAGAVPCEAELVPLDDGRHLTPELVQLCRRHDPSLTAEALSAFDEPIHAKYLTPKAVLMFSFADQDAGTEGCDQEDLILEKVKMCHKLHRSFKRHNGISVEHQLIIFPDCPSAVRAATLAKRDIVEYNSRQKLEYQKIRVVGWGIHLGPLLFIPDTDVHWGDPVNTASKLGQDLAQNGDLLITDAVHSQVKDLPEFSKPHTFSPRSLKMSGVTFNCFSVTTEPAEGKAAEGDTTEGETGLKGQESQDDGDGVVIEWHDASQGPNPSEAKKDLEKDEPSTGGKMTREQLCNDVLNTSVMASLIGGFALSNLQHLMDAGTSPNPLDQWVYILSVVAVHACTCSALCSALLYRAGNQMQDDEVANWVENPWVKRLIHLPMAKFSGGCIFYLVSVVLLSSRDLEGADLFRYAAVVIGVMSVAMVFMTSAAITALSQRPH